MTALPLYPAARRERARRRVRIGEGVAEGRRRRRSARRRHCAARDRLPHDLRPEPTAEAASRPTEPTANRERRAGLPSGCPGVSRRTREELVTRPPVGFRRERRPRSGSAEGSLRPPLGPPAAGRRLRVAPKRVGVTPWARGRRGEGGSRAPRAAPVSAPAHPRNRRGGGLWRKSGESAPRREIPRKAWRGWGPACGGTGGIAKRLTPPDRRGSARPETRRRHRVFWSKREGGALSPQADPRLP